jgi:predicted glycosyltransferase
VQKANSDLYSNFPTCSLHLTSYSTTAFECALLGIPTVFMQCLSDEFSMFKKDYDYPFNYSLVEVFNDYINCSSKANNWAKSYYIDFNEDKFIKCLEL